MLVNLISCRSFLVITNKNKNKTDRDKTTRQQDNKTTRDRTKNIDQQTKYCLDQNQCGSVADRELTLLKISLKFTFFKRIVFLTNKYAPQTKM